MVEAGVTSGSNRPREYEEVRTKRILLIVAAAIALQASGLAQTTFATITGLVTDPQGAVISGAEVTATRLGSNYKCAARTNELGYYTIGQLLQGEYTMRVEMQGFSAYVRKDIVLTANQLLRADVRLEVGAVATTIEVTGGVTPIETESARISDTKLADEIKNLPLNTRTLWNFVGQNPGIVTAASGTVTRRFSGSRNNQSDAAVDGITVSNGRDGTQITPLVNYVESFQEVRVDMGNNSAEFGGLGQVTVVSKSGSNDLHGAGFDYYSTPKFQSRNPFATSSSRGLDLVAGGWSLSFIYSYRSGRFLTPLWTGADPTGTAYTTSSTAPNVTIRPDILRDGNLPSSQQSINRWFDPSAFAAPGAYFGTSARGVIKGPHSNVWDAGVFKSFPISRERVMLRWELTAVNILNHPNYNDPSQMTINQTGSSGIINGVGGNSNVSGASAPLDPAGPRGFRTALRLEF